MWVFSSNHNTIWSVCHPVYSQITYFSCRWHAVMACCINCDRLTFYRYGIPPLFILPGCRTGPYCLTLTLARDLSIKESDLDSNTRDLGLDSDSRFTSHKKRSADPVGILFINEDGGAPTSCRTIQTTWALLQLQTTWNRRRGATNSTQIWQRGSNLWKQGS
jgi:hypothetical protein